MLEKLPRAVGHTLQQHCAGLDEIAWSQVAHRLHGNIAAIEVHSPVFDEGGEIPRRYTADGEGISPPLAWTGIPPQADSLVVMVEDPDAPMPHPLVHAIVVDLDPEEEALPEGALKSSRRPGLNSGLNSYLQANWLPPNPPPGHGVHRYAFQVFALSAGPDFPETPGREVVLDALRERTIAAGFLIGIYQRE